ncbi:MAG: nucleotidyl transferase AbiEii/AbiGii toxin family protein [Candidatus Odinarchaeota archaeon]
MMKSLLGKKNETVKSFEDAKSFEFKRKMSMNDLQHFAELMGTEDLARVESEYFQDLILYILSGYPDIVFKGGTALRKFWNAERFSADLDFVGNIPENILDDLLVKLSQRGYPTRISEIREYGDGNITVKLAIRGIVYLYHHVTIDLFPTSPVTLPPRSKQLVSIFPDIPAFTIPVMSPTETLAEKIRTLFSRDNPQDLHDVSFLLDVVSPDWQLVKDKFEYDGLTFSLDELR